MLCPLAIAQIRGKQATKLKYLDLRPFVLLILNACIWE
uniref:Uncharacterized protein n=1 Tax=Arundo donax TaxID=35708 RepID=A0A0A9Q7I9_ARUDO